MKYYRVKTGFGSDDFISIDENEVATALKAQVTGKIGIFKSGSISGNSILSIIPDYQREMGWNRDYSLTGEDYEYIGGKKQEEYSLFLENTKLALEGKPPKEQLKEISQGVKQLSEKMSV